MAAYVWYLTILTGLTHAHPDSSDASADFLLSYILLWYILHLLDTLPIPHTTCISRCTLLHERICILDRIVLQAEPLSLQAIERTNYGVGESEKEPNL